MPLKGMAKGEGKHLYHETLPPLITHTEAQEADARAKGYGDTYVFHEYPKQIGDVIVNNAEEEAAARPFTFSKKKGKE